MVVMHCGGVEIINHSKLIDVENAVVELKSTSITAQILQVLQVRDSKWILGLITYNIVIIYYLCSWVTSTNSIALIAYANTIFFNVFALLVCLISIWVEQNITKNEAFRKGTEPKSIFRQYPEYRQTLAAKSNLSSKQHDGSSKSREVSCYRDGKFMENFGKLCFENSTANSFDSKSITVLGLEKYEVLALLVSSCLSLMAGSYISVQLIARLTDQPNIHTGRLGLGALLGFLAHLGTILAYPDAGLNHVVCKALPCPTLRGCNPILGGNMISAVILTGTHLVIHFWEIHITDTAAAFAVIGLTSASMLPLAFYTLSVILQKLPRHMNEQLDKCLREALVIDGVLELRNERFWTKSFGKLAGSVQVRIRRNANENRVLDSVMRRLSRIVSTLTVQEFREPRFNDVPSYRPVEYYINEILPRTVTRRSNSQKDQFSRNEIDADVKIMRIDDILGADDSQIETFAIQSGKIDAKFKNLTIYKNDNVSIKDRLYRGDLTENNALLFGTKLDVERFENLSIVDHCLINESEIIN